MNQHFPCVLAVSALTDALGGATLIFLARNALLHRYSISFAKADRADK